MDGKTQMDFDWLEILKGNNKAVTFKIKDLELHNEIFNNVKDICRKRDVSTKDTFLISNTLSIMLMKMLIDRASQPKEGE